MIDKNVKNLQNLSKVCHRSGILPIFLGILIIFIGGIDGNLYILTVGLLIFIVGYSYVKIADKIKKNLG